MKNVAAHETSDSITNAIKTVHLVKDWVRVCQTNYIFDTANNLNFDQINMKITDLCANNKTLPLRLSVFCFKNSGTHKLYGRVITSIKEIEMGGREMTIFDKRGRRAGQLKVDNLKIDMKPSLIAYLNSGWQLDCSIAIDFTLSNGTINDRRSKHRQDKKRKGRKQEARDGKQLAAQMHH